MSAACMICTLSFTWHAQVVYYMSIIGIHWHNLKLTSYFSQCVMDLHTVKICCIGSKEYPGDTFEPLIGDRLRTYGYNNVYGTSIEPLDAVTLLEHSNQNNFPGMVIAIDAGFTENVELEGMLHLQCCSLLPGSAFGKDLPSIGDVSIFFYVSHTGFPGQPLLALYNPCGWEKSSYAANVVARALDDALRNLAIDNLTGMRSSIAQKP